MATAGIDVYSLPLYQGMHRVREPQLPLRHGVVSIISEDPDRAAALPYETLARDVWRDHGLTFAADGDWIYLFRRGDPSAVQMESMLLALQRFARAIDHPRSPSPLGPT